MGIRVRRELSRVVLAFAGLLLAHSRVSVGQQFVPPTYERDPRLLILKEFLKRHKAPVHHLSDEFLEAADRNKLDWRLLPSIALVESGAGRTSTNNNLFGWDSGRAGFASVEDGIHYVAGRLAHSNLYRNKSLDGKLRTYNPFPGYPARVKSVMTRLSPSRLPAAGLFN